MRKLVDADALKKKFVAQRDKIEKEKKYGWEFTANGLNIAISITGIEAALYGVDATQPEKCEDCGNFNKTMLLIPQPEQQWIPCTERLPDKTDKYLVTVNKNGELATTFTVWLNQENPKWASLDDVIAWQPLPEPWKGKE